MSRRQRVRRTTLALLASGFAVAWLITVGLLLVEPSAVDAGRLLTALWVSGLAALGLTVAACRVADDSTDDPEYFGSIVQGIREEWQRSSRPL